MNMKTLETIRQIGELKRSCQSMDSAFILWVMRVGEARNILNNALLKFFEVKDIMIQLERNIPQFHKQPGSFRDLSTHINQMMSTIANVNNVLSYIPQEEKKSDKKIDEEDENEEDEDEDEDDDE